MHPELQKIADMVNGRPCLVMANGPSLADLQHVALPEEVCYCGMNKTGPAIQTILEPQELGMEVIFNAAPQRLFEEYTALYNHMAAGGLWITRWNAWTVWRRQVGARFANETRDKTAIMDCEHGRPTDPKQAYHLFEPVSWDVLSVALITLALLAAGTERVALAGADGGRSRDKSYFQDEAYNERERQLPLLTRDVANLNKGWDELAERAGVQFPGERIRNLCLSSNHDCWPKTRLEDGIAWLLA